MVNIRTESPIDTNFSDQYGDNSNFDGSEKKYLDVFIYINGSKVYPGESSFIFHSKNVAVNNHAWIQEFSSGGGVQVSLTKKALTTFFYTFFSPQLILQKSNGQFQRILSFFKVPEGVQHFPGGGPTFSRGGFQLLISYRNPYNL